jgi:hypothetical protein
MKLLLSLVVALLTIQIVTQAQTIRRCNNTPGITGPNIYSTIQAAHDAAAPGDIIYIEPSSVNYGSLACGKRLTIYGRGYYFDQTPDKTNIGNTDLTNVTFGSGSTGTTLSGVFISRDMIFTGAISNVTVERCFINGSTTFTSNCAEAPIRPINCTLKQCYFNSGGVFGSCGDPIERNSSGINILNCIVVSFNTWSIQNLNNVSITNSILQNGTRLLTNCTITNSIFNGISTNSIRATSYANNISTQNDLPSGNGNVGGVAWTTLYNVANPRSEADYQLSASSAAKGTGTNGTDIGAFGGPNPYVLTGQPPIPIITNLVSSPSGNNNAPLNVRISVRSNN